MSVRRNAMIENGGRSVIMNGGRRKNVEDISGKMKSIVPIGRRDGGVDEVCANNVVESANNAFCFAILGRCVWTREANFHTILST